MRHAKLRDALPKGQWTRYNHSGAGYTGDQAFRFTSPRWVFGSDGPLAAWCEQFPEGADVRNRDVYQFGVFLGRSLRELVRIFEGVGARTMVRAVWGFDTFTGMPDSANDDREATLASEWGTGQYSASDKDILYDRLRRWANASSLPVSFVRGEYRHTLTPSLAAERGMRPASYIDIDCDTYPSSFAALDWMFSSNLVVSESMSAVTVSSEGNAAAVAASASAGGVAYHST